MVRFSARRKSSIAFGIDLKYLDNLLYIKFALSFEWICTILIHLRPEKVCVQSSMVTDEQLCKRVALGSGKGDPMLQSISKIDYLLQRQTFSKVLVATTLSVAFMHSPALGQSDGKKPGIEPVAASSPASKSAMGESPLKQTSAQSLPKPETAKTGTGSKGAEGTGKPASAPATPAAPDKPALPFPVIASDSVGTVQGVQPVQSRVFPSAIDIHGSAAGVLLHARRETRYDLLSPLSIWLEEGPLLVSVRKPSDMVLVATKFGDICVTDGGDALVERGEEDTLRIVNLGTSGDNVFLNMHDKLWTGSPWGHLGKVQQLNENKKGKKTRTYENIESGAVSLSPGYELVIGAQSLSLDDVKPPDSVGRREFRTFEGGRFVIAEISIDNLTQLHDLIKNLNTHGEKAGTIFNEIMKNAGLHKSRQGETGFEKNIPKPVERKKPPPKTPPKSPPPKPKAPPPAGGATGGSGPSGSGNSPSPAASAGSKTPSNSSVKTPAGTPASQTGSKPSSATPSPASSKPQANPEASGK